jgi:hypothetical protein
MASKTLWILKLLPLLLLHAFDPIKQVPSRNDGLHSIIKARKISPSRGCYNMHMRIGRKQKKRLLG